MAATNQLADSMVVAGTKLVNFQASAAILSADLQRILT
jgi:hypothetical protein